MCITWAEHINHSVFHHSPMACFRFWNDKQTETEQNKRLHWLHLYYAGFACMHYHTPHKRHGSCMHLANFILSSWCWQNAISIQGMSCIACHLGQTAGVSSVRSGCGPLLCLWPACVRVVYACWAAVQHCAALCTTLLLISAFHHTPADPV